LLQIDTDQNYLKVFVYYWKKDIQVW